LKDIFKELFQKPGKKQRDGNESLVSRETENKTEWRRIPVVNTSQVYSVGLSAANQWRIQNFIMGGADGRREGSGDSPEKN